MAFLLPDSKERLLKDNELQAWADELTKPFSEDGAGLQVLISIYSFNFELLFPLILSLGQLVTQFVEPSLFDLHLLNNLQFIIKVSISVHQNILYHPENTLKPLA